jgi:hypothetical protein
VDDGHPDSTDQSDVLQQAERVCSQSQELLRQRRLIREEAQRLKRKRQFLLPPYLRGGGHD